MKKSTQLGELGINRLLVKQSVPAAVGILVMSIYMIVDTIFVGRWVGSMAIAAITVVMPINFLISSLGMSIGIGGGSIISRSLGAGNDEHASRTFGNQIIMTLVLALVAVVPGYFLDGPIIRLFGGQGKIYNPAMEYYHILLVGVPFLAWAMMANNVIRSQGYPRTAMMVMLIPAFANLILDPIFILVLDWGLAGAAWATTISYIASALFTIWFFIFGRSELRMRWDHMQLRRKIYGEITSLGVVTFARQGAISLLYIVLNNSLVIYGGELYVSVYGIINRIMMFALFPVLGLTQGALPIAGYNYGARLFRRVRATMNKAILIGTVISGSICLLVLGFREPLVQMFTKDPELIDITAPVVIIVFLATPVVASQLLGAAYFQAVGKATPALLLTLLRQGFCLVPLILILPQFYGLDGIWYAFPAADILSTGITWIFMRRELILLKRAQETEPEDLNELGVQPETVEVRDL